MGALFIGMVVDKIFLDNNRGASHAWKPNSRNLSSVSSPRLILYAKLKTREIGNRRMPGIFRREILVAKYWAGKPKGSL